MLTPEEDAPYDLLSADDDAFCMESACALHVEGIEIRETHVGKGLFVTRDFPVDSVIGEIDGVLIEDADYSSSYAFDFGDNLSLEPDPPFRYLNHSCDPNCEYIWTEDEGVEDFRDARCLYIAALRNVYAGEQLTIDYGWHAEAAIRCLCGSSKCRGWIVCEEELEVLLSDE